MFRFMFLLLNFTVKFLEPLVGRAYAKQIWKVHSWQRKLLAMDISHLMFVIPFWGSAFFWEMGAAGQDLPTDPLQTKLHHLSLP